MVSIKNSGGEKWGKSCTHSVRRAHDTTSHHTPQHHPEEALFSAIAAFLRGLGALREQRTPSRGGQWGARWGTPGSEVGNPGERGREHCGAAPRGQMENPGERNGATPSGSRNTMLRKTEDPQNGHTHSSATPERKLPLNILRSLLSQITIAKHGTDSTTTSKRQARTEPITRSNTARSTHSHVSLTPHAHSCTYGNVGGRICVMVAQHS